MDENDHKHSWLVSQGKNALMFNIQIILFESTKSTFSVKWLLGRNSTAQMSQMWRFAETIVGCGCRTSNEV